MSSLRDVNADKLSHPTVQSFKNGYGSDFTQDFVDSRSEVNDGHLDLVVEQQAKCKNPEKILEILDNTKDEFVKQSETLGYFKYRDFDVFLEIGSQSLKVSTHAIVLPDQDKKAEKLGSAVKSSMQEVLDLIQMLNH